VLTSRTSSPRSTTRLSSPDFAEIAGRSYGYERSPRAGEVEEHDLTIRRLNEYKARLTNLQKEKVRPATLLQ